MDEKHTETSVSATRTDSTAPPTADVAPLGQIGPYRLLSQIGGGGMGEVYLAEQTRPVHRRVALKVIKAGMDTALVIARFEAERQALALMDHPSIARVFDAGTTSAGRPFFVMEYVPGEPITNYASRHRLSIADRVKLLIDVCAAVQHAHQKGIIHRDLKPSNILVSVRGGAAMPKIIDFGVAKAMTHSLTDKTLHTEFGALIGTPEYMSPEQAEMTPLDVDTRTDVYAVGVVLYELLTQTLPFEPERLRNKPLAEIRRVIRESDPPRPSTRLKATTVSTASSPSVKVDARRLFSQMSGDLDWITMKALEKDRTRRYATVGELAADLERQGRNEPVIARPPTSAYRMQKFVRRNTIAVASAIIGSIVLTAVATEMAVQTRRIGRERDRANLEAATAQKVSDFLAGLFRVSDPSEARGNSITARELLDRGAASLDKELASEPEIQSRLLVQIGRIYDNLGLYPQAESLVRRSLQVRTATLGPSAPDTLASVNLLGAVVADEHKFSEAEELFRRAAEDRRKTIGRAHPDTLKSVANLAAVLMFEKKYEEAERYMRDAMDIRRTLLGNDAPDTLMSLNNFAYLLVAEGKPVEAERYARDAAERSQRLQGDDDPRTLAYFETLGTALKFGDRWKEATVVFMHTLQLRQKILGPHHLHTLVTSLDVAECQIVIGEGAKADKTLSDAFAAEQVFPPGDKRTFFKIVARLRNDQARYGEAELFARRALSNAADAYASILLGESLLGRRRFAEAEQLLINGYDGIEGDHEVTPDERRHALRTLVTLYEIWGKPERATFWKARMEKEGRAKL
jgi:serine/threonine protein kinase/tetratricopeptide (TPR) repeat protein